MKNTFILIFCLTALNARRSGGRSGSSSRSTSRLNTNSKLDPSLIGPSIDAKRISTSHPNCYMYISCFYKLSPALRKIQSSGHIAQPDEKTRNFASKHIDKKINNQPSENSRGKPKKTKRKRLKKTRKMESKDKPDIRSLTNNSIVKGVSHRKKKNLKTKLMRQDSSKSLQTSDCNSPYKCNGFNENWFPQSNDIDLKLSLILIITVFI